MSLVDVKTRVEAIEKDPSDNRILSCAKEANMQFVVSGDRHLLQLGDYENIRILTASRYLETQKSLNRMNADADHHLPKMSAVILN